ncbi:MAG: hypothetical protein M3131_10810 [Actinomycetota bacterium]|nr:hypothetical protein [Actinomycetota bacterium]
MSMTDRDKKIALVLIPLLVLAGYWFLLLAPKREEAAKAADALAKQEQRRDAARQRANALASSKTNFAADYEELVRLGKAIPSSIDMPSLIVQLDGAARGTGTKLSRIATGERTETPAPAATPPKAPGSGDGSQPAAAGGQGAASGPGKAAEAAGNATNGANSASAQRSGASAGGTGASSASGLETVPLELEFKGNFFNLADFFHRLKRFVRVANDRVLVRGRLLTIDTLKFSSDPQLFPKLKAEITATVYLSPKAGGTTAGATPQGPSSTAPAGGSTSPASTPPTSPAPTQAPTP